MFKYFFLFILALPVHAHQTKQEIIGYCTRIYLKDYGNWMVLSCVKQELKSQNELESLAKS